MENNLTEEQAKQELIKLNVDVEALEEKRNKFKQKIRLLKTKNEVCNKIIKELVDSKQTQLIRHIKNIEQVRQDERVRIIKYLTELSISGKIEMVSINLEQIEQAITADQQSCEVKGANK